MDDDLCECMGYLTSAAAAAWITWLQRSVGGTQLATPSVDAEAKLFYFVTYKRMHL